MALSEMNNETFQYDKEKEDGTSDIPLSGKAALAMGIPRNGAVSRVWAEADPLVARRA